MSTEIVSSLLKQENVSTKETVPVEHLDYGYIEKCTDVKYLENILMVLRSGEEGIYPHLIQFCESHLERLEPKSRALRKETPAATAASFSKDEWSHITDELKMWEREAKMSEIELKQQSLFHDDENVPPVRGSNCSVSLSRTAVSNGQKKHSKKILPRDYKEWDKFDVDKECAEIDGNVKKNYSPTNINPGHSKIKCKINTTALTDQEKVVRANREKDKGNEAFKANDFEEAVAYYTRSLAVIPTIAAYNNRAQAEIKLQHWHSALNDCQRVLELEPSNMKALLRRATVQKQRGNFQMAAEDLRNVLQAEPQNMMATKLLIEVDKKISEGTQEKPVEHKKILIQEVEEDDEDGEKEVEQNACPVDPSQPVGGESAAAPAERGDMGNAQKKPHGRGEGGPQTESTNSHSHWRGKGGSSEKYRVAQESAEKELANGTQEGKSSSGAQGSSKAAGAGGNGSNLDAPSGSLPPPLARLKNEGNQLFKNGQFADALEKYSQAITGFTDSGIDSPEDLCILHSNRAACYLKDGNSLDCIQDCTRALELQPFSLKPLLRRAMAYDTLERYRKAYVDYKTVLQIDIGVQAAHDSVNRITRVLIEQDGTEWREKLPDIPLVPISAQQHRREEPPSAEILEARAERAAQDAARKAEARFTSMKQEGNEFVKKGQFQDALEKYNECLKLRPDECAIYTNRALCLLKLDYFAEAKHDCDSALKLEPTNKKAFYRRAMANKGLKDYLACSSDLQEVLQQDPNVQEAEKELEEVTVLLRQSLAAGSPAKARRSVPITEVDGDEETTDTTDRTTAGVEVPTTSENPSGEIAINLQPTNAYEFGQSLNAARSQGNISACADLLCCVPPETLPLYLSNQLDGHTIHFIMQALDKHLIEKDPNLVYQHLNHLHKASRFSVVLMLLEQSERRQMTQLFDHLSAVDSEEFTKNDVQNLANKYI